MSNDGAHLGVGAKRALDTILGGEPSPSPEEGMDPFTMRRWLLDARWPLPDDTDDTDAYNECARYAAKLVLEWLLADPKRATSPMETEYDWDADPDRGAKAVGWYDQMKADGIPIGELGLSGFMWGWAANAARYCVELPPARNPAIL